MFELFVKKLKKILVNTPINQKFISLITLRKRLLEVMPYAKGRLLDVGCGEKRHAQFFHGKIDEYIGTDLPNCYFEEMKADVFSDAHSLPFKSESFDTIFCTQVLVHLKDPNQVFKEFARVLKKNRYLIVSATKAYPKIRSGAEYFRYTDDGLRYLAEDSSLTVIYNKPICGLPATIGLYLSRYFYGNFLINKKTKKPIAWRYPLVLPIIVIIQMIFLLLDKIHDLDSWETDTIAYVMVAKKESA